MRFLTRRAGRSIGRGCASITYTAYTRIARATYPSISGSFYSGIPSSAITAITRPSSSAITVATITAITFGMRDVRKVNFKKIINTKMSHRKNEYKNYKK